MADKYFPEKGDVVGGATTASTTVSNTIDIGKPIARRKGATAVM